MIYTSYPTGKTFKYENNLFLYTDLVIHFDFMSISASVLHKNYQSWLSPHYSSHIVLFSWVGSAFYLVSKVFLICRKFLTLSLCCSALWFASFWSWSVSRSRLQPSWKRYDLKESVMWWGVCLRVIFRRRRRNGEKEEEERMSHIHTGWEKVGSNQYKTGNERQYESKTFSSPAQRQIVWFKLCAADVRGT